jgi:glycine/D-amino acid oxidase-like deaminating enzyme
VGSDGSVSEAQRKPVKIAITGGGVFGAMSAIDLAENGHAVTIFERLDGLLQGTSRNANRLHLGFHYPRDSQTARQCALGYERFRCDFGAAVLPGVANAYFIANEGSLVSPEDFLAFCDDHGLSYREINPARYRAGMSEATLGVLTDEVMYDPSILKGLVEDRLRDAGVSICCSTGIDHIERTDNGGFVLVDSGNGKHRADAIINCSYANLSRIGSHLGFEATNRQYEYIALPVIEFPERDIPSVTVLDGPFFGLLPLNSGGEILVYHVRHSVVAREDSQLVDPAWLDPQTAPFATIDREDWLKTMFDEASRYMPELKRARVKGFREGPRMVLADVEDTDARPSIITHPEPGYIEVFSGKVVHSMWVGGEVGRLLDAS